MQTLITPAITLDRPLFVSYICCCLYHSYVCNTHSVSFISYMKKGRWASGRGCFCSTKGIRRHRGCDVLQSVFYEGIWYKKTQMKVLWKKIALREVNMLSVKLLLLIQKKTQSLPNSYNIFLSTSQDSQGHFTQQAQNERVGWKVKIQNRVTINTKTEFLNLVFISRFGIADRCPYEWLEVNIGGQEVLFMQIVWKMLK